MKLIVLAFIITQALCFDHMLWNFTFPVVSPVPYGVSTLERARFAYFNDGRIVIPVTTTLPFPPPDNAYDFTFNATGSSVDVSIISMPVMSNGPPLVFHDEALDVMITTHGGMGGGPVITVSNDSIIYYYQQPAGEFPEQFTPFYISLIYSTNYSDIRANSISDRSLLWTFRVNIPDVRLYNYITQAQNYLTCEDKVFFAIGSIFEIANIFCLNATTGTLIWYRNITVVGQSIILTLLDENRIGLIQSNVFTALDRDNGSIVFTSGIACQNPLSFNNKLYCSNNGIITKYRYNPNTGNLNFKWSQNLQNNSRTFTCFGKTRHIIYVTVSTISGSNIYILDSEDGDIIDSESHPKPLIMSCNRIKKELNFVANSFEQIGGNSGLTVYYIVTTDMKNNEL